MDHSQGGHITRFFFTKVDQNMSDKEPENGQRYFLSKTFFEFDQKCETNLLLQLDIFEHFDEICLLIRPLVVLIRQP